MYEESGTEDVTPFIRHSRIVKRFNLQPPLPDSPALPPEDQYGPEFWERLKRQPSVPVSWVPGMKSGYPAWRTNLEYPSQSSPRLESLPSPSELYRSKKKKKSDGVCSRREMCVQHHIQELRKKQSSIDQLKSMTWGSRSLPEMEVNEGLPLSMSVPLEVPGIEPRQESFPDFFETCQTGRPEGPFLDFSPPNSTSDVQFPWMAPRDDFSFLDNSDDGWRGAGSPFFQE